MVWEMKNDSSGERLYSEGSGRVNRPNRSYVRFQSNANVATICFFTDEIKQFSWMQAGICMDITGRNRNENQVLIEHVEKGNLLSVDGKRNAKKWLRLHVSIRDACVLREWLKINRTEQVRVPFSIAASDQTLQGLVLQFENDCSGIQPAYPAIFKHSDKQADISPMIDRMLVWFSFDHLPDHLKLVSQPFFVVAHRLCELCEPGPERTVALRKLLEAKDAAVRARLHPGG
jgi:hypothetical protein